MISGAFLIGGEQMLTIFVALHTLGLTAKRRLTKDDTGATAVEYGLMVGLIAVAIIITVTALGGQLNALFNEITTALQ